MLMWIGARIYCLLLVLAIMPLLSGTAAAQLCGNVSTGTSFVTSLSASSMAVGTYDPFQATVPKTVTVTFTTTRACTMSLVFYRTPVAAVMTSGTSTLSYQIEAVGGGNSYLALGGTVPATTNRLDITTTAAGTFTRQVQVRVVASQIVASGTYSDTGINMALISQSTTGQWYYVFQTAVTPSATVPMICRLDAPSPASLSWIATEIPNGTPNPANIKSTTMTAACTAPTIVRLTGSALALTPTATSSAGFDNFINYRGVGTFGAATSTLTTTTTVASASSAAKNVTSGATTSGSVSVNVNLIAGNTAMAGSYSGVLTVTIDPNL
jgi:hypothetical protein